MFPVLLHICGMIVELQTVDDGHVATYQWVCPRCGPVRPLRDQFQIQEIET